MDSGLFLGGFRLDLGFFGAVFELFSLLPPLTKSTRSSASQWKHLRKRRRVKRATKRGLKSSLKTVKARQVSVTAYHERSRRC